MITTSNQWLRSVGDTNQNTHKKKMDKYYCYFHSKLNGIVFILASEPAKDVNNLFDFKYNKTKTS